MKEELAWSNALCIIIVKNNCEKQVWIDGSTPFGSPRSWRSQEHSLANIEKTDFWKSKQPSEKGGGGGAAMH